MTSSRNTKNSSRSNLKGSIRAIGGTRLSIWLISFDVCPPRELEINHIIAEVAAEEPLELGGLFVPDGIGATLNALPTIKTSHPTQELSTPTLCSRGVVRAQRAVMLQSGTPAFPPAWKPTSFASQVTAAESVTLGGAGFFFFSKFLTKTEWRHVQLKPRDTIREMLAKLSGCGGDDIIDTFDFRKPDFAAGSFCSCTARVKKRVVFLPW